MSKILAKGAPEAVSDRAFGTSGTDMCGVYINMLCERYKNRGATTRVRHDAMMQAKRHMSNAVKAPDAYCASAVGVSPYDEKYRTGMWRGMAFMSSNDFANYYRDLRNYKTPEQASRTELEYENIRRGSIERQKAADAGTRSKKARWLALTAKIRAGFTRIGSHISPEEYKRLSDEWFPSDSEEDRREGKATKMPVGIITSFAIITVSLLLIVSSKVMVSRAEIEVAALEDSIEENEKERDKLLNDMEMNDMLMIREWAEKNGMVSGKYVNSRYIDTKKDDAITSYDKKEEKSLISKLLEAIGLINDD